MSGPGGANIFKGRFANAFYQMQPGQTETDWLKFTINAAVNDGQDAPGYSGPGTEVLLSNMDQDNVFSQFIGLADQNMMGINGAYTTPFQGGSWTGYARWRIIKPAGPNNTLTVALQAFSQNYGIGGSIQYCTIQMASAPPTQMSQVILYNQGTPVYNQSLPNPVDLKLTLNGQMIFPSYMGGSH